MQPAQDLEDEDTEGVLSNSPRPPSSIAADDFDELVEQSLNRGVAQRLTSSESESGPSKRKNSDEHESRRRKRSRSEDEESEEEQSEESALSANDADDESFAVWRRAKNAAARNAGKKPVPAQKGKNLSPGRLY